KAARAAYQQALGICTKLHGEQHWKTTNARHTLEHVDLLSKLPEGDRDKMALARRLEDRGIAAFSQARYGEAEEAFQAALKSRCEVFGEQHRATARSYNNLASALHQQERYREAEQFDRKALAIHSKLLGDEHPDTARSYNNLALHLHRQRQ